jgi:hypothetical protein
MNIRQYIDLFENIEEGALDTIHGISNKLKKMDKDYDSTFKKTIAKMSVSDAMAEYGFKSIGSGQQGVVFENPSYPYVIKFFINDIGYLKWLKFCYNNRSNPYVPEYKGKVVKITNDCMAIRIEKCHFANSAYEHAQAKIITEIADNIEADEMTTVESIIEDNGLENDEYLKQIINELANNAKLNDLHQDNIMFSNKTGHIVIIDPYYSWNENVDDYEITSSDALNLKQLF